MTLFVCQDELVKLTGSTSLSALILMRDFSEYMPQTFRSIKDKQLTVTALGRAVTPLRTRIALEKQN